MTRRAFAYVASLLLAAPIAAASAVAAGVGRFLLVLESLFAPEPFRVATTGVSLDRAIGGTALARDLQQSLRHEAGVPRVSAARNV